MSLLEKKKVPGELQARTVVVAVVAMTLGKKRAVAAEVIIKAKKKRKL